MAKADLSNYNLKELKALQSDVEKEIKDRQQHDVRKAREQILAIAQDIGVSVEDLLANTSGKSKGGARTKVQPQYKNPTDDSQMWSGRGRKPKWVVDVLESGKKLEDLKL